MRYATDVITRQEEETLLNALSSLPFKEFEFHGFVGKRRVISFGWHYDFNGGGLRQTEELPEFLLPVRERAARFAGWRLLRSSTRCCSTTHPAPQSAGTRTAPPLAM